MGEPRKHPVHVELPSYGVTAFESVHCSDFEAPPFEHTFWKSLLCLKGAGSVQTDNELCGAPSPLIATVSSPY
jgi:hypothetical protein